MRVRSDREYAMRRVLQLCLDVTTAFLFAASIGVAVGVVAVSFTHRLADLLTFGLPGFLLASATFGYFIWRSYRPGAEKVPGRTGRIPTRQVA
jgi:hypothetical protein